MYRESKALFIKVSHISLISILKELRNATPAAEAKVWNVLFTSNVVPITYKVDMFQIFIAKIFFLLVIPSGMFLVGHPVETRNIVKHFR